MTYGKVTYRQGTSYARGTDIDAYLSDADVKLLYERWKPEWAEPLRFSGGITSITCEMVLEIGEDEFTKALGKAAAKRILEAAHRNGGR